MSTIVRSIIKSLESYKYSDTAHSMATVFPYESKRQLNYINNIIQQLDLFLRKPSLELLDNIIDDISETLKQEFLLLDRSEHVLQKYNHVNKLLNDMLDKLKLYRPNFIDSEKKRTQIKYKFLTFSQNLNLLIKKLSMISEFLENQLTDINDINTKDLENNNLDEVSFQRFKKIWHELLHCYQNQLQAGKRTYKSFLITPINILPDKQQAKLVLTSDKNSEHLYYCQEYLNLNLNFKAYINELTKYKSLHNITAIKINIRNIYKILCRLNLIFEKLGMQSENISNVIKLVKTDFHSHMQLVKLAKFNKTLQTDLIKIYHLVTSLKNDAKIIIAYVYDASITNIRDRNLQTRLDSLLQGKLYEPLNEQQILNLFELLKMSSKSNELYNSEDCRSDFSPTNLVSD